VCVCVCVVCCVCVCVCVCTLQVEQTSIPFQFLGAFSEIARRDYLLRQVCPSVRTSTWNSAPTGRIFMKFDMRIFRKSVKKIQVTLKSGKNNGTAHEDQ